MISIIVPMCNESAIIIHTLKKLLELEKDVDTEIILVDGESTDDTLSRVQAFMNEAEHAKTLGSPCSTPIKLLTSQRNRGTQLNHGASHAEGDILWFLHADCIVESKGATALAHAVEGGRLYGCFSLYFYDSASVWLRIIAWGSRLRAKYAGLVFGDQGMFIEKKLFFDTGMYKSIRMMEDYEFSRRMHKLCRPLILPQRIGTSARKFLSEGILRTFTKTQWVKFLFRIGVSPDYISRIYRSTQKTAKKNGASQLT